MTQLTASFPTTNPSSHAGAHGNARTSNRANSVSEEAINAILGAIERVRFGSVAITLHEGRVVQVDITEKKRLTNA